MSVEKVVIIIPCYNEAEVIEKTIHQVFAATSDADACDVFVLIFDSASTDDTPVIVQRLQAFYPNLIFQSEPRKTGLGSAYWQAMNYALTELNADVIFEFDADLSHQPIYLKPILNQLKTCDVVLGSRYVKNGSIPSDWGWHRKILSIMGNGIARLFLTRKYKDFTSGFRATRRNALLKSLPKSFLSNAYAYKLELLWRLHQNGARIVEHPIAFIDRKQGYSKLPTNSIVDSMRVLIKLRYASIRSYAKMCLVGAVGLGVQIAAYNALRNHLSPINAAKIAVGCAILNNYLLNNRFTFKHPAEWGYYQKLKSVVIFAGYSLVLILCQSYWMQLVTQSFGRGLLKENAALLTGVIFGSWLNYFVYSRIVWQEPNHAQ